DACLLANTLNFSQDPHQLLREVHRVLNDDGYLFLSLFNPAGKLLFKRYLHNKHNEEKLIFRQFLTCRI
ncbi:MAG TPA: SAM-dependent methyltransferase, partial [Pasteurellaceae bacterium]|nr:SAM-dependent methyltransferase [Pasteurellaceae bacterium]